MLRTEEQVLIDEYSTIINRTIVAIRPLKDTELKQLYWDKTHGDLAFAIILDDGQVMIPSSDPECNGPGYILMADLSKK